MNLTAMKCLVFLASILLLTASVWAQVEPLPEDTVENNPYHSAECEAYFAALEAVPPNFLRPQFSRAYYEEEIRRFEPIAGLTEFDLEKYNALEQAIVQKKQSLKEVDGRIRKLEEGLAEAKNNNNETLIAELKAKLDVAANEEVTIYNELKSDQVLLDKMWAARDVLDAKRSLTLLVLWQEFDIINEKASLAAANIEKELNSVKAEFEAEKARFTQEYQTLLPLKQQSDRSEFLEKERDLKLRSAEAFTKMKNRLQKFICWPEVQTFDEKLQNVIAKLRTSKTSLPFGADFEIEELPEDGDKPGKDSTGCTSPNVVGRYTIELDGYSAGLLSIDSQSGNHVSGKYGQNESSLVNTIEGNFSADECRVLEGTFRNTQYNSQGKFSFTFQPDGGGFSGSWSHTDKSHSGSWSGTRRRQISYVPFCFRKQTTAQHSLLLQGREPLFRLALILRSKSFRKMKIHLAKVSRTKANPAKQAI